MKMAKAKSSPRLTRLAAVGTAVFFATRRSVEPAGGGSVGCVVAPGGGPGAREVRQQPNADPGRQVLLDVRGHDGPPARGPGGAGDVEVRPGHVAHEVREEPRSGDRAGRGAADVLDVAQ